MLKRKIELLMTLLLLIGAIVASKKLSQLVTSENVSEGRQIVVIDAGHGGTDPGKVGINNALEKDINLAIAKKVEILLEEHGIQVVMTREDDTSEESKLADMKKRVALINEVKPVIAVSIHQNSYSDSGIKGAQVFYYTSSTVSEELALLMQEELRQIDTENTRQAKGNETFYMLKKTKVPTIIVECGFLSNAKEAENLATDSYQQELANMICNGIIKWLDK